MADIVISQVGPLWTLDEVKTHLRVDHGDEDDLIRSYMDAAEQAMLRFCNINLVPYGKEGTFKIAGMIIVTAFFDSRMASESQDGVPYSARRLIFPYRWLPV